MQLTDTVAVITGGGSGIGAALARRFAAEGAAHIVVVDRAPDTAEAVAAEVGGTAEQVDVTDPGAVQDLVDRTLGAHGRIDLFASNAGIATGGGLDDDEMWQRVLAVNTLAHVYAARAVLPAMLNRGSGYLLQTASAAGLLSISDASYAVTKHGAVAFAEWLSITYGDRGIRVSCFCPMGVRTNMLLGSVSEADQPALLAGAVSPEAAADAVAQGLEEERFLILTHPEVLEYMRRKSADYDRWLHGMRRFQKQPPAAS